MSARGDFSDIVHPSRRRNNDTSMPSTNVFVNYLPKDFTKDDLVAICSKFGTILSAKVMIDLVTGCSKCYGFVRFENLTSARIAVEHLDGLVIGEKKLIAKFACSSEKLGTPTQTLFVKSLPLCITEEQLMRIFSPYGKIIGLSVAKGFHLPKAHRGCYVMFSTVEEAQKAIRDLNNVRLNSDSWPLFIRFSENNIEPTLDISGIRVQKPVKSSDSSPRTSDDEDPAFINSSFVSVTAAAVNSFIGIEDMYFSVIAEDPMAF